MNISSNGHDPSPEMDVNELPLEVELDEESWAQLDDLIGKALLGIALWTEPLAAALADELSEEDRRALESVVDVDLYFEDHMLLELYSAMVYPNEDEEPIEGVDRISETLSRLVARGLHLVDVAEEEETGAPILIFEDFKGGPGCLIVADGWVVDTWEKLPEEEELE